MTVKVHKLFKVHNILLKRRKEADDEIAVVILVAELPRIVSFFIKIFIMKRNFVPPHTATWAQAGDLGFKVVYT